MTNDMTNGLFELIGSGFLVLNVVKLQRDKEVKGVSWIAVGFFFLWGLWNLFYYPSLNQWFSFAGGCCIATVNAVWLGMLIWYSCRETIAFEGQGNCDECGTHGPQLLIGGKWLCSECLDDA